MLTTLLLGAALVSFFLGLLDVTKGKINWVALGLLLWVISILLGTYVK